ncbi:MAG: DUF2764 domain-containing protein [Candidatus Omnitrophica bacterium]|nr:DUF2764 domain-containing protein [Candidatus Omnitrophota bacterium]MBU4478172.1 DUF2764 domain-containing protein [Candidatus Omnitrophota bacterium]MCG2703666.1 DUF2764 domain-containing protein [Candidatus Omnitrophota bacterium]
MNRPYYYLIASLPLLRLDDYKEPYRVMEFVAELDEHLSERHCRYVRDVLFVNDCAGLARELMKTDKPLSLLEGDTLVLAQRLRCGKADTDDIYLCQLLTDYEQARKENTAMSVQETEDFFLRECYRFILRHENRFIRNYFRFDFELRSILVALNKRKMNLTQVNFSEIGEDDSIAGKLKTSTLNDFGLSQEIDYLPGLIEIFMKPDLVHTEKYIDQLRWEAVDTINTFSYFEIDVLLGYLIKLMLVERWIVLDNHKGQEIFQKYTKYKE